MRSHQCPYQTLPPDVWSECLSHLPPEDLSKAAELLPLVTTPKSNDLGGSTTSHENDNDTNNDAEHAAWLAVRSMVTIAEKHWEAEEAEATEEHKTDEHAKPTPSSCSKDKDTQALELRKLVSEDTTIVGVLLRNSSDRTNRASATSRRSNTNEVAEQQRRAERTKYRPFFRFRDETWQKLYGLLYKVLNESDGKDSVEMIESIDDDHDDDDLESYSDAEWEFSFAQSFAQSFAGDGSIPRDALVGDDGNGDDSGNKTGDGRFDAGVHDKEGIALAVGLVFGAPPLPAALMTLPRRKKLARIADACCSTVDHERKLPRCLLSDARCYLLSLRLADEGLWDIASNMMTSRSSFAKNKNNRRQPSTRAASSSDGVLLSIDGMIYTSTFLIDRLYSQTFVRDNEDDAELAVAVYLGRKAVEMADERYKAYHAKQMNSPPLKGESQTEPQTTDQPPPPMESLFANDALRCIHAKLALGKALALLAQHTGLQVSDTRSLRHHKVLPLAEPPLESAIHEIRVEDEEHLRLTENFPRHREQILWTESFFAESRRHLENGLRVCEIQCLMVCDKRIGSTRFTKAAAGLNLLIGALKSAEGERDYCAASVAYSMGKRHRMDYHAKISIQRFSNTFHWMMSGILDATSQPEGSLEAAGWSCGLDETALDILLRCGKDLGKACSFANAVGMDLDPENPQFFLDFAYVLSIYRHGSFHPTTVNIARLSEQRGAHVDDRDGSSEQRLLAQKYRSVVAWLVAKYSSGTASISKHASYPSISDLIEGKKWL